jgi:murein L,D-transpeptidase YcbB/YkuD
MMSARFGRFLLFTTVAAIPAGLAFAQPAATAARPPAPAAQQAPVAAQLAPAPPEAFPAPAPVPLPPPVWTMGDAIQLLAMIDAIGAEGLDPADYDAAGLRTALASGDPRAFSVAATERFDLLASDIALGHVRRSDRQSWLIPDPDLDSERRDALLRSALQQHRVGETLRGLLPTHPQYAALKTALSATPTSETGKINRIRINMDRWRWLPRDLGERYIIVNVPAYTAALVENGITTSRHRAVAGATKTPTPQLMATATGVIFNPWWEVPKSIEPEVRGKRGYVAVKNDAGKIIRWRQPPGPSNALGRIKFVMPNDEAIYLHDTNARGLFDTKSRAYSHGCIRTEHIIALASKLLTEGEGAEWTPEKIAEARASKKSVQASFAQPLPVYIVYMSSAALGDGKVKDYADIYKRDGKVIAALLDRQKPENQVASR